MGRDLNHHASQRIHAESKALKASAGFWRVRATGYRYSAPTARGQRRATSSCGSVWGEAPGERIPDVAVG